MNQTRWSSLSAALIFSTVSFLPLGQALEAQVVSTPSLLEDSHQPSLQDLLASEGTAERSSSPKSSSVAEPVPVKVGETQSDSSQDGLDLVARVIAHEIDQTRAATLYVRDIPVLTFLDPSTDPIYVEIEQSEDTSSDLQPQKALTRKGASSAQTHQNIQNETSPTWQASRVAAHLNELARQNNDEEITVSWSEEQFGYVIAQGDVEIATISRLTILPDTTENWEEDALQATNRLRRLLQQAPPLSTIENKRLPAAPSVQAARSQQRFSQNGLASWYGPGFHGRLSASGEVFDAQAMTAAHPSLPFGTQLRVTNLDNGQSIVVRVNDRGPYHGNRILDVSQAAATALGMLGTGVAPVQLDVLN